MKIHFLGTGCMIPTKERNHLSIALERKGDIFLFDCGEATQLQIRKKKLSLSKIKKIFISHWHGDHVIGLPGLLMSLGNTQGVEGIEIHGPIGSKEFIKHMKKSCIFDVRIDIKVFEHDIKENKVKKIIETSEYEVCASKLNHSVLCLGYSFIEKDKLNIDKEKAKNFGLESSPLLARAKMGLSIEYKGKKIKPNEITYKKKGKKITFIFDTRPCQGINLLAENSDYLIMEATLIYSQHANKAYEYDHMTAKETAIIASENNVKTLLITHFSQRYKDIKDIEDEAKEFFENTIASYDLMSYTIK